ncbi:MAG TPA: tetratricopeptide repeat protein [Thioploca sp.]|nr:tetratricopeptide repeat protein [Thioploca sp.]
MYQLQHQCLEDYATSIDILQNALTKTSNPTEQAITLGSLGQACFMQGKTKSAITLLETSINTFPKATTLNNLGNVYAPYSENKKIAKALVYYKQSSDLATQIGYQSST